MRNVTGVWVGVQFCFFSVFQMAKMGEIKEAEGIRI
jgi:hypothetical protein